VGIHWWAFHFCNDYCQIVSADVIWQLVLFGYSNFVLAFGSFLRCQRYQESNRTSVGVGASAMDRQIVSINGVCVRGSVSLGTGGTVPIPITLKFLISDLDCESLHEYPCRNSEIVLLLLSGNARRVE
jgi:hypothetical protein